MSITYTTILIWNKHRFVWCIWEAIAMLSCYLPKTPLELSRFWLPPITCLSPAPCYHAYMQLKWYVIITTCLDDASFNSLGCQYLGAMKEQKVIVDRHIIGITKTWVGHQYCRWLATYLCRSSLYIILVSLVQGNSQPYHCLHNHLQRKSVKVDQWCLIIVFEMHIDKSKERDTNIICFVLLVCDMHATL